MNFNTAVKNAIDGDSDSFAFLCSSTYPEMYYLAVKYIKDDNDAESIVQDSYAKAKNNMGMLHDVDKFRLWLGCIVANTALSYLKRKKPLLFSSIGGEDNNGESFIYEPLDDSDVYQPKIAYSNQELKNLINELIDSLSDEQRMCIIMYHFNKQSIRATADSMECSENTVKSRLYYGRNTLRKKMEFLRKNGYQINGSAPIPFFKYLLEKEFSIMETQLFEKKDVINTNEHITRQMPENTNSFEYVTYTTLGASDIKGFFKTMTGKLTIVLVAFVILSGAMTAITIVSDDNLRKIFDSSIITDDGNDLSNNKSHYRDTDNNSQSSSSSSVKLTAGETVIPDEDFQKLVRGELSKEQLAFVLARLPGDYDIENDKNETIDYIKIFCADIEEKGEEVGFTSPSGVYSDKEFKVDEINRILSSFKKNEKITSDNHPGELINNGSTLLLNVIPNKEKVKAVFIYQKNKNNESLEIVYELHQYNGSNGTVTKRRATLLPIVDEKFVITKIVTEGSVDTDNIMYPINSTVSELNTDHETVSRKMKDTEKNTDTENHITSDANESSMIPSQNEEESSSQLPESEKTKQSSEPNSMISHIEQNELSSNTSEESQLNNSQPDNSTDIIEDKLAIAKDNFLNIDGDHYFFDIDNDGVEEGVVIDKGTCSFYIYNDDSVAYEFSASTSDLNRPELKTNGRELIIIRNNDDPVNIFIVMKNGSEISFEPLPDLNIEGYEPLEQV